LKSRLFSPSIKVEATKYAKVPLYNKPIIFTGDHLKSRLFSPLTKVEATKYAKILYLRTHVLLTGDHLKSRLFSPLTKVEATKYAKIPEHPSIFACIFRRRGGGLPRKLECHGFVCKSQDDAISVAAQLYQGLLDAIRRNGSKVECFFFTFILVS
jgi:hypothetical protein